MITSVPKNEVWWLWALAIWIFFLSGRGWSSAADLSISAIFLFFISGLWPCGSSRLFWLCFLAFKLTFHEASLDIKPVHEDNQEGGA